MEQKKYSSYADIDRDLEILKLEKEIHYQKLLLSVKKTKESLSKSVKSPFDMFAEPYTQSNDVMEVFEAITNYINGEN